MKYNNTAQEPQLPPTVQSLKGVLKGSGIQKEDYKKYLEEKNVSLPVHEPGEFLGAFELLKKAE